MGWDMTDAATQRPIGPGDRHALGSWARSLRGGLVPGSRGVTVAVAAATTYLAEDIHGYVTSIMTMTAATTTAHAISNQPQRLIPHSLHDERRAGPGPPDASVPCPSPTGHHRGIRAMPPTHPTLTRAAMRAKAAAHRHLHRLPRSPQLPAVARADGRGRGRIHARPLLYTYPRSQDRKLSFWLNPPAQRRMCMRRPQAT